MPNSDETGAVSADENTVTDNSASDDAHGMPDPAVVLVPKLDERFALSRSQFVVLVGVCLFFMYYNYMRLFHSDFWGHVSYGTWILENERLPEQDMFLSHAEGVPVVATAWGAQVILGLIGRLGDDEYFSHLYAITVFLSFIVLGLTFRAQSGSSRPALLACGCVLIIWLSRHTVIRPEIFALLCFAVTLLLTTLSDSRRTRDSCDALPLSSSQMAVHLIAIFALYFLWANLHGSFFVGFAVLGAYALGRAIEVAWQGRDLLAAFADKVVQQRMIAFWVAFAGTVLNPYLLDLHVYTLRFPMNRNLLDVEEWYSLDMTFMEGPSMAFSWILACVLFRHSRRRILPADVILLLVFSTAVCMRVRMTQWYAPVAAFVLAPHIGDCYRQFVEWLEKGDSADFVTWMRYRSFRTSLIGLFIIWLTFCFSPVSRLVLGGAPRQPDHVYSADTPRGVTEYFRRNPPRGQVMNPQWWGDWLIWDGPENIQAFMTTNALHVTPATVWRDYMAMSRADAGFETLLTKYRVNTIVICKALQQTLLREAPRMPGWETVFEDDTALVVARIGTLPPELEDDNGDDTLASSLTAATGR
ncbi:MAG: hypothetical protein H8E37_01575 [Planctomycetes bacterium]|nr:hypothetical protein [Planctomycetota bacterium]